MNAAMSILGAVVLGAIRCSDGDTTNASNEEAAGGSGNARGSGGSSSPDPSVGGSSGGGENGGDGGGGAPEPSPPPVGGDALTNLSDEFDSPSTLGDWARIWQTEGWPYDQLETFDIGATREGFLTMVPYTSSWFEDYRGILAYKVVEGNFVATTRVVVSARDGNGAPSVSFSLAGIMVRTPRDITAETWTPGGENYIFLSAGSADSAGELQSEVKTTIDSRSTLDITPGAADVEIRVARFGEHFLLLRRETNSSWAVHRRYHRPDMPDSLQVGMVSYTDWSRVGSANPTEYNNWTAPPDDGSPDLRAQFDFYRFAVPEPPSTWDGLDLSDATTVSDADVLEALGTD